MSHNWRAGTATLPDTSGPESGAAPTASRRTNAPRRRTFSVAAIATALVVVGCALLVSLHVWLASQARRVQIDKAVVHGENLSKAVAEAINRSIAEADHVVSGIQFELERSDLSAASIERIQPVLVNNAVNLEQLGGLFVYGTQGEWLVSSSAQWNPSLNNSDREYFRFHRDDASDGLHLGDPLVSRSSGRWVVPLSRRLGRVDGGFGGVVLATLDIGRIGAFLDGFDIGQRGAISLVRTDGTLLVRRPFAESDLGRSLAGTDVFRKISASHGGTATSVSPIDGEERLIGFQRLDRYGVIAVAALSKDEVLQDWRQDVTGQSVLALAGCLVFAGAGAYVVVLIRRLSTNADRLAGLRDQLTVANAALARSAREDGLTGLPNRRSFDEALRHAGQRAARSGRPVSVVMIDVDHFKGYNDAFGHAAGDDCLRRVAKALDGAVRRPDDVAARYGGEEFVLVLPDTDAEGAMTVAEAARQAVNDLRLAHAPGFPAFVSVSAGVATGLPGGRSDPTHLLEAADRALYDAKHGGRNRTVAAAAGT